MHLGMKIEIRSNTPIKHSVWPCNFMCLLEGCVSILFHGGIVQSPMSPNVCLRRPYSFCVFTNKCFHQFMWKHSNSNFPFSILIDWYVFTTRWNPHLESLSAGYTYLHMYLMPFQKSGCGYLAECWGEKPVLGEAGPFPWVVGRLLSGPAL